MNFSQSQWIFYVFCWVLLSVGVRAADPGLSLDGLVYAATAFRMSVTGDWIHMSSGTPVYNEFFEHPHLFFWVLASFLKIFPAEDWALRLPTQVLFFLGQVVWVNSLVKRKLWRMALVVPVIPLVIPGLTQWFNNSFIDGFFFALVGLSFLALWNQRMILSGVLLGFAGLTKGTTVLAIGPVFAFFFIHKVWTHPSNWKSDLRDLSFCFLSFVGVLMAYYTLVSWVFNYPEFFTLHYDRHFTNRFLPEWNFRGALSLNLWKPVFLASSALFVLVPFAIHRARSLWAGLGLVWLASWSLMYGGASRWGGWYTIPFSVAALIATIFLVGLFLERWDAIQTWKHRLYLVPLFLVGVAQALPVSWRARTPDPELFPIRNLSVKMGCDVVNVEGKCESQGFDCFSWAWYLRTPIRDQASRAERGCHLRKVKTDGIYSHAQYQFWTVTD